MNLNEKHGSFILILSWTLVTCFICFEAGRIYARTEMKKQYEFGSTKPAFGKWVKK